MSIILIVTLWRSLNTIETLLNFYKKKYSSSEEKKAYFDAIIKDKTLFKFITNEFLALL
jgi:hypothetical protein